MTTKNNLDSTAESTSIPFDDAPSESQIGRRDKEHNYDASTEPQMLKTQIDWMTENYDGVYVDYGSAYGDPYFQLCGTIRKIK